METDELIEHARRLIADLSRVRSDNDETLFNTTYLQAKELFRVHTANDGSFYEDVVNLRRGISASPKTYARHLTSTLEGYIKYAGAGLSQKISLDDLHGSDTQESDAIFAEVDQLIANSLLPRQFRDVVATDLRDAQVAYTAGGFKACVVMLGAALEGVMLGTLQREDVLTLLSTSPSSPGPIRKIGARDPSLADKIGSELSFEDYKVCIHELVKGSDGLGVDNIQSFRNAIHPWKTIQEPLKYSAFDRARALHYVGSLKKIAEAVCQWTP